MATNKAKYKAHSFRKLLNQYVCVHVFSEIPVRCPQTLSLSLQSLHKCAVTKHMWPDRYETDFWGFIMSQPKWLCVVCSVFSDAWANPGPGWSPILSTHYSQWPQQSTGQQTQKQRAKTAH